MHMPSLRGWKKLAHRHLHFIGPGLVSAVAYIDPGNWATDLQAGAEYGYKLLFVVLIASLSAVVLQTLAVRLGVTTASSLPHETRKLFLRLEAKYPKYRVALHCGLWALYILAEIAIIATDLAELLGSAIALHLLFPKLPLWAGVLVTAVDVLIVLAFFNSSKGRQGMMLFEILIVSLVLAVFISFMILLRLVRPDWGDVFYGYVPSNTLFKPGALYIGVGIIGATVMPHALFLGSSLAGVDRLNMQPQAPEPDRSSSYREKLHKLPGLFKRKGRDTHAENDAGYELEEVRSRARQQSLGGGDHGRQSVGASSQIEGEREVGKDVVQFENEDGAGGESAYESAMKQYEEEMRGFDRIRWVDIHLRHATIDTTFCLLGFALVINSSILILAGASFYYNPDATGEPDISGAFNLMKSFIGNSAAICFAVALLCAGQSASITATLAGQVVSEGFINWRTNPAVRRMITRLISSIPAATVAAAVGQQGLNTMLVASQVMLSIILPTVIFPLVFLCSKDDVMTVEAPIVEQDSATATIPAGPAEAEAGTPAGVEADSNGRVGVAQTQKKSYKSPKWITILGYLLFAIVVIANAYVIVQLALGNA